MFATAAMFIAFTVQAFSGYECAMVTAWSGRMTFHCGSTHLVRIPSGALFRVVHNHPGGSSLSLSDLLVLERVHEIEATTPAGRRFIARKGPAYAELLTQYDRVATEVSMRLARQRRIRGYVRWHTRERLINAAIARLGIIDYREQ